MVDKVFPNKGDRQQGGCGGGGGGKQEEAAVGRALLATHAAQWACHRVDPGLI